MTKSAIVKTISGVTAASAVTIPSAYLANKHLQEKGKGANINENMDDGMDRKGKNERDVRVPETVNHNSAEQNQCAHNLQKIAIEIKKDFTNHFENGDWSTPKNPKMNFSDEEKNNFPRRKEELEAWKNNSSGGCISEENKTKMEGNIAKIKDFFGSEKKELEKFKSEVIDPLRDILRMSGIKGWEGLL